MRPAEAIRPFAGLEAAGGLGPHVPRPERLDATVQSLPGVGPKLGASLGALGIGTVRDLLFHRPRRYEPPAPLRRTCDLLAGEEATIEGEVEHAAKRPTRRRGLTIVEARVRDSGGALTAIWFNQVWLADRLKPGARVRLRGALERGEFVVRDYDLDGSDALSRIAPVYRASEAISSKRLRELVACALPAVRDLPDPLPATLRAALALPLGPDAVSVLHRPRSAEEAERGRRRLAFEELLVLQLGLLRRRAEGAGAVAPAPHVRREGQSSFQSSWRRRSR